MKDDVGSVLRYFRQFDYIPTVEEIFTFFPRKITKKELKDHIERLNKDTLREYPRKIKKQIEKSKETEKKIKKVMPYVHFLSRLAQVQLVGLSGTAAMMSTKEGDDIDFFIITTKNRLWTARFLANIAAWFYGLKRKPKARHAKDKVCLNMFFDEKSLEVPKFKQNLYVAHEVVQMKPIINKNRVHETFLKANRWVIDYFPNSKLKIFNLNSNFKLEISNSKIGDIAEALLKYLQLFLINRHRTTEIILDGQLWFHPDDFQKKVKFATK